MKRIISIIIATIILVTAIPINSLVFADSNTAVVTASRNSGRVLSGTYIELFTSDSTCDIWYTVDGSDPTTSETACWYRGYEILITKDIMIKAVAKNDKLGFGKVAEFNYDCINSYITDDILWKIVKVTHSASLDTENKKVGKNSIKFVGGAGHLISTDDIKIDCTYDYKLSFWMKTDRIPSKDVFDFRVFLASPGGGGDENHPLVSGARGATLGNYGKSFFDIGLTQDWKYYEVDIIDMSGISAINIILNCQAGGSTFWIDGVSLTAQPKATYPLEVESFSTVHANVYTQSTSSDFVVEQGIRINNNAKNIEQGTLKFDVYNDMNPDTVIQSGKIDVSIVGKEKRTQNLKLESIKEYGTYTVKFTMTNKNGVVYDAGYVRLSRLIDNTYLIENGGTYLGACGAVGNDKEGKLQNSIGNSMLRLDYPWEKVEAQKGVYKVDTTLDLYINTMVDYNIEPLLIINSAWPTWMEKRGWPTTDSDIEHFLGYIRFLVETYKGKVKYFEFFNEINGRAYRSDLFTDAKGYTETMKLVYTVLKEANPDAILLGGGMEGFGTSWATEMFKNGAADYMDYYSFHPYCQDVSPESANWLGNFYELNNAIKAEIGREFPLFITETGMAVARTTVKGHTAYDQMTYLTRMFTMAKSFTNLEKIVTYQIGSTTSIYSTEMQYGMMGGDGAARPLAVARAAFNHLHNGFTFNSIVDKFSEDLYCYKFSSGSEDMYVLWTNDVEYDVTITTSSNAKIYDIFGNLKASGENIKTNIGSSIIYVRLNKGAAIKSITLQNERPTDSTQKSPENIPSDRIPSSITSKNDSESKTSSANFSKNNKTENKDKDSNTTDTENESESEETDVVIEEVLKEKAEKNSNTILIIAIVMSVLAVAMVAGVVWYAIRLKKQRV